LVGLDDVEAALADDDSDDELSDDDGDLKALDPADRDRDQKGERGDGDERNVRYPVRLHPTLLLARRIRACGGTRIAPGRRGSSATPTRYPSTLRRRSLCVRALCSAERNARSRSAC